MLTDAVCIRNSVTSKSNSVLYEIDSNVKFSLTADKDNILYAKNPHYGWQRCTAAQTKNLPPGKVKDAIDFVGNEVVLNSGGRREITMQNEEIPSEYRQQHETCENSCVCLAACLVIRSVDVHLASVLLALYHQDQPKFEWLRIFNKRAENCDSLYKFFQWTMNVILLFAGYVSQKNIKT